MDGGGFFRTMTAAPMRPWAAVVTGYAAAFRLAKSARSVTDGGGGRRRRDGDIGWCRSDGGGHGRRMDGLRCGVPPCWARPKRKGGVRMSAAEVGGGGRRRRWAAEVGGGGRRRR